MKNVILIFTLLVVTVIMAEQLQNQQPQHPIGSLPSIPGGKVISPSGDTNMLINILNASKAGGDPSATPSPIPGSLASIPGHRIITREYDTESLLRALKAESNGTAGASVIIPNFTPQRQLETNWCWLACSAAIHNFYAPNNAITQCHLLGLLNGHGQTVCNNPAAYNVPGFPSIALQYLKNLQNSGVISQLHNQGIEVEINAHRPMVVAYTQPQQNVGHAIILIGYETGTDTIYIMDPSTGSGSAPLSGIIKAYSQLPSQVCTSKA